MAWTAKFLTVCFTLRALAGMKGDTLGEAFSGLGTDRDTVSVTYAMAAITGYELEHAEGWISPQLLEDLGEVHSYPTAGPVEQADEIPTEKQYYDGHSNLVHCALYTTQASCSQQPICIWCVPSETCHEEKECSQTGSFLQKS